jgi:hypothetical protein
MPISSEGVSDFAYTTNGGALGVSALNSDADNPVGGLGVSVLYGVNPLVTYIVTEDGKFLAAEDGKRLVIE